LTMAITYFYYLLMPKTTYLVQHLNTKEQLDLYAEANRSMQWRGLVGTLLGFLGLALVPFITNQIRKL
jgi:hypothetical protein